MKSWVQPWKTVNESFSLKNWSKGGQSGSEAEGNILGVEPDTPWLSGSFKADSPAGSPGRKLGTGWGAALRAGNEACSALSRGPR